MTYGYRIIFAVLLILTSAHLAAQNPDLNECFQQTMPFAGCSNQYEGEYSPNDPRLVEPLMQVASQSLLHQNFKQADAALSRAREIVRFNEGLYTREQVPILIMQAENHINSGNWVEARKLQDHLIWLFQSKFSNPDQSMIRELQELSRLHMRGVALDEGAYRVAHYIRALFSNRLAIVAANDVWPAKDERKAELFYEQLRIMHMRASQAMERGFLLPASSEAEQFPGSWLLDLSEKLTLGDIRKSGVRYLKRLRQLYSGDDRKDLEARGVVALYEAGWLSLFDREAEVRNSYNESRQLLGRAGISQKVITEVMEQPLFQPELEFHASAEQLLRARATQARKALANNAGNPQERVSFASLGLLSP